MSEAVLITVITVILGPSAVAYITWRIKNAKSKPDRIDTVFDMYEAIIKRKDDEIKRLDEENTLLRAELAKKGEEV